MWLSGCILDSIPLENFLRRSAWNGIHNLWLVLKHADHYANTSKTKHIVDT